MPTTRSERPSFRKFDNCSDVMHLTDRTGTSILVYPSGISPRKDLSARAKWKRSASLFSGSLMSRSVISPFFSTSKPRACLGLITVSLSSVPPAPLYCESLCAQDADISKRATTISLNSTFIFIQVYIRFRHSQDDMPSRLFPRDFPKRGRCRRKECIFSPYPPLW